MKNDAIGEKIKSIEFKIFFWTRIIGLCAVISCVIYLFTALIGIVNYIEIKKQNDIINYNSIHINEFEIDTSSVIFIDLDLNDNFFKSLNDKFKNEVFSDKREFERNPFKFFSSRNKDVSLKVTNTGNVAMRDITIDFVFGEDLCKVINNYFKNKGNNLNLSIDKNEIIYANKKFYSTIIALFETNKVYGVPSFYSKYISMMQKGDAIEYEIPHEVCLLFSLLRIVSKNEKNIDYGFNGMIKLSISYVDEKNNFKNLYFDFFNKNFLVTHNMGLLYDASPSITLMPIISKID